MSPRVIHTSQALVDQVMEVPRLPYRGGNVVATPPQLIAASAVTVLRAAARSGAQCVHAGSVGTGPNGDAIRAALDAEGITLASPPITDADTGVCVVLIEPSAERSFITAQGAERMISVASLSSADPQPDDLVCVSGYTLVGATSQPLLAWLDELDAGVRVVLDPGDSFAEVAAPDRARVLARTDLWTSNAAEAEVLTGQSEMSRSAPAMAAFLPPHAMIVVRDGPRGCTVAHRGQTTVVPGYPQRPVDTNGAGDTHTGVLLAELAKGVELLEAARRANAAGAITVTRRGPETAPNAAEIDAFLASWQG